MIYHNRNSTTNIAKRTPLTNKWNVPIIDYLIYSMFDIRVLQYKVIHIVERYNVKWVTPVAI